jgi:hypothetical protein
MHPERVAALAARAALLTEEQAASEVAEGDPIEGEEGVVDGRNDMEEVALGKQEAAGLHNGGNNKDDAAEGGGKAGGGKSRAARTSSKGVGKRMEGLVERWNAARAEAEEEERLDAQLEAEPTLLILEQRKRKRLAEWVERMPAEEAESNVNFAPLGGGGGAMGDWRDRVAAARSKRLRGNKESDEPSPRS